MEAGLLDTHHSAYRAAVGRGTCTTLGTLDRHRPATGGCSPQNQAAKACALRRPGARGFYSRGHLAVPPGCTAWLYRLAVPASVSSAESSCLSMAARSMLAPMNTISCTPGAHTRHQHRPLHLHCWRHSGSSAAGRLAAGSSSSSRRQQGQQQRAYGSAAPLAAAPHRRRPPAAGRRTRCRRC